MLAQPVTEYAAQSAHDLIVQQALAIIESRVKRRDVTLTSPQAVREFLRLKLREYANETLVALFLDSQNRLIVAEELVEGVLASNSVCPAAVVKAALARNAAAV